MIKRIGCETKFFWKPISAKQSFARIKGRSQMEFGNEERKGGI